MYLENAILYSSDSRGIYIPQYFTETIRDDRVKSNQPIEEDMDILRKGVDEEWYWDAWENILNNVTVFDDNGVEYALYQEGDLWLVPLDDYMKGDDYDDDETV